MEPGDLILPKHLRQKLKNPLGRLVSNPNEICNILAGRYIISVGDQTTESLLEKKVLPHICVYDGKIKRAEIEIPDVIRDFDAREIHIKNPKGHLTRDAFEAMSNALAATKTRTKIVVDGEEDLIALAAINLAPAGTLVLYGQPDEGVVVVEVNDNIKEKIEKILEGMKNEN